MFISTSLLVFSVLCIGVHGTKFHKWDPLQEGYQFAPGNNYSVESFQKEDLLLASRQAFNDLYLEYEPDCEINLKGFSSMIMCKIVNEDKESNTVIIETYIDFCVPDSMLPGISCSMKLCRQKQNIAQWEKSTDSEDLLVVFLIFFLGLCTFLVPIFLLWKIDESLYGTGQIPEQVSAHEIKSDDENVEEGEDSGEETASELESEEHMQSETEFDNNSSNSSFEIIAEETYSVE